MKKIFCCFFTLIFVASSASLLYTSAAQSSITKPEITYDIAVVFDNSGSMYGQEGSNSWCRAKYAMEVFGSMLNYERGDSMEIFPMWYVSTTKTPASKSQKVEPVSITSMEDLEKITYMYTPCTDGGVDTPFEPVEEAYSALQSSEKDKKWLVVLTDGTFNKDIRSQKVAEDYTKEKLKSKLLSKCSGSISVQYLAIGEEINENADLSEYTNGTDFFADLAKNTEAVTDKMIEICNRIFERQILDNKYIGSSSIELDVSMTKLIIFVAGKNAAIKSLTDSKGNKMIPVSDSGVRKYSSLKYSHGKAGKSSFYNTKVDDSLYGQVITYGNCVQGKYTLDYVGKIQAFYEPDIKIDIKVASDKSGTDIIEPNSDGDVKTLEEGNYYVFYDLADNVTNSVVTDSPLIKSKGLRASVVSIIDDKEGAETKLAASGSSISFKEGETIYFKVVGEYLNGYKIRTSDNAKEYTFRIVKPTTLKAKVTQTQDWYCTKDLSEWDPITVKVNLAGEALSKDIFNKCTLTVNTEPKISYKVVPDASSSGYTVYFGKDKNDKSVIPDVGNYHVEFSVKCNDDNEKIRSSKTDDANFEIRGYPFWYRIIAAILLLLLLIGIILFIMSRKAMPKKIVLVTDSTEFKVKGKKVEGIHANVKYDKKGKSLKVITPPYDINTAATGSITLRLQPVDRLWTKSKNRRVHISGISASGFVNDIDLNGTTYEKHPKFHQWVDSSYIDEDNDVLRPVDQNIKNASVEINFRDGRKAISYLKCELKHK